MSKIETTSGRWFDFANPKIDDIYFEDIAKSLSKEQRFTNFLDYEWSVLQHVLLVTFLTKTLYKGNQLDMYAALHHDDPEAYFRDLPTPLKQMLPEYQRFYNKTARVIATKAGMPFDDLIHLPEIVKKADKISMYIEAYFFNIKPASWIPFEQKDYDELNIQCERQLKPFLTEIKELSQEEAVNTYLYTHNMLKSKLLDPKGTIT